MMKDFPIYTISGKRVVIDSDLAEIYGVTVKRLNEQVKRNIKKFPPYFSFVIEKEDLVVIRSQFATLKKEGQGKHRKYPPRVFTEHGALMASTLLNSTKAVAMSVYVIRAFVKMREQLIADTVILKRMAEVEKTLLQHDQSLWDLYQKLVPLLNPPSDENEKEMGFHAEEEPATYNTQAKINI